MVIRAVHAFMKEQFDKQRNHYETLPSKSDDADAALATEHVTTTDTRLVLLGQNAPPVVTGVYVRSAGWNPVFRDWMQGTGMADADGYYQIPTDEDQLDTLPWSGLSDVRLAFSDGGLLDELLSKNGS